jgi:hypothetical protein
MNKENVVHILNEIPFSDVAQVVECLPCKHKILNSNPTTARKQKRKDRKEKSFSLKKRKRKILLFVMT